MTSRAGVLERQVEQSLVAATPWWKSRDSPDPLVRADILARPDLVAQAIERRRARGSTLGTPHTVPYLKPNGGTRRIATLDPIADTDLRLRVDPIASRIYASTSSAVEGTRLELVSETWRAEDWRSALRRRETRSACLRSETQWKYEVVVDVRKHFESIVFEELVRILNTTLAPTWAIKPLVESLSSIGELRGHPKGLPTGPEVSAVLGTFYLAAVDRVITTFGAAHFRWMDDIVAFALSESHAHEVYGRIERQLTLIGESPNDAKTQIRPVGSHDLDGSADGDFVSVSSDPLLALWMAALSEEWREVPMALGILRSRHDLSGIAVLSENPTILRLFPKQSGQYIREVASDIVDWGFVTDLLLEPTTDENAAAQIHLADSLPTRATSQEFARDITDRADRLDVDGFHVVADHLFACGARRQKARQRDRASYLDRAEESGRLNRRRSLMSIARQGPSARDRRQIENLVHLDEDLAATADWVLK